jgi:hypothetical protein
MEVSTSFFAKKAAKNSHLLGDVGAAVITRASTSWPGLTGPSTPLSTDQQMMP